MAAELKVWKVAGPKLLEVVEAIACEVQVGALLFWDGGLHRAFGSGAWSKVWRLPEGALDLCCTYCMARTGEPCEGPCGNDVKGVRVSDAQKPVDQ